MRSRWVVATLVLAVVLAGCAWFPGGPPRTGLPIGSSGCRSGSLPAPGIEDRSITSNGVARSYLRRVPQGYDARRPAPLVMSIHGFAEGSVIHTQMSEMGPIADANGIVVVYPQGLGSPPRWDNRIGSPDLAYIGHVLDEVERDLCIDRRRVFVQGLSMGAFMTSSVACQYAGRVAAVGMVAGMLDVPGCAPSRKVPAVTFHGTEDTFVPFGPIPGNVAAWAERNHCATQPREDFVADDVTLVKYLCPVGAEVGFYRIAGGGHAWPGSEFSRQIEGVVGYTTFSIDASEIMWNFYRRHPMPLFAR